MVSVRIHKLKNMIPDMFGHNEKKIQKHNSWVCETQHQNLSSLCVESWHSVQKKFQTSQGNGKRSYIKAHKQINE